MTSVTELKKLLEWRWFYGVVSLILSLVLLFQMVYLVKDALSTHQAGRAIIPSPKKIVLKNQRPDFALSVGLFGRYVPVSASGASIKPSTLNLKIVGVLYAEDEHDSVVMIAGQEALYRLGDKVPGGAIIKHITPDGVVFERDGTLERLNLPKDELRTKGSV